MCVCHSCKAPTNLVSMRPPSCPNLQIHRTKVMRDTYPHFFVVLGPSPEVHRSTITKGIPGYFADRIILEHARSTGDKENLPNVETLQSTELNKFVPSNHGSRLYLHILTIHHDYGVQSIGNQALMPSSSQALPASLESRRNS